MIDLVTKLVTGRGVKMCGTPFFTGFVRPLPIGFEPRLSLAWKPRKLKVCGVFSCQKLSSPIVPYDVLR